MVPSGSADAAGPTLASRVAAVVGRASRSPFALVLLALLVGAVTGLAGMLFRWLIALFTRLFTGYDDYAGIGRAANAHWPALGSWFLLLTPVIAGAIYGPLVHRFAPEARGLGVPEVLYATAEQGGRIPSIPDSCYAEVLTSTAFNARNCKASTGTRGRSDYRFE